MPYPHPAELRRGGGGVQARFTEEIEPMKAIHLADTYAPCEGHGRPFTLGRFVVPTGLQPQPVAKGEASMHLIQPVGTPNPGTAAMAAPRAWIGTDASESPSGD